MKLFLLHCLEGLIYIASYELCRALGRMAARYLASRKVEKSSQQRADQSSCQRKQQRDDRSLVVPLEDRPSSPYPDVQGTGRKVDVRAAKPMTGHVRTGRVII